MENIKRGADWTVPYHIGHVSALVKRVDLGDDIWGFFAPFTPMAWAFFFSLVLVYGFLTYAVEQVELGTVPIAFNLKLFCPFIGP